MCRVCAGVQECAWGYAHMCGDVHIVHGCIWMNQIPNNYKSLSAADFNTYPV